MKKLLLVAVLFIGAITNAQTVDATVNVAAAGTSAVQSGLSGSVGQATYDKTNSQLIINGNADNLVTTLDYVINVGPVATAANSIVEGDINYVITGGTANDTIVAGSGADTITGGAGIDIITPGPGKDTMTGGGAADVFHIVTATAGSTLALANTITDFTTAVDDIDVGTAASFTEEDGAAFTEASFAIRAAIAFDSTGTDAFIAFNAAGSGNAWLLIDHDAGGTVTAADTFVILNGINQASEFITGDII